MYKRQAGEDNVFSINGPSSGGVLSGPNGAPTATGSSGGNNDDFTNKSVVIPPGIAPGATVNPAGVSFTNSVQNTGTGPANISLLPTPPANAGDLPNGTTVTITKDANSATYSYDASTGFFTFVPGSGTGVGVNGAAITATNPVGIANVAANGGTDTYGVSVDLPASAQFTGYPVSITAFADGGATPNGLPDVTEAQNITINRVYTGFLKLVKKSRVLQGTGPAVGAGQGDFESTPATAGFDPNTAVTDVNRVPAPGNIIEYRIEYTNISTTGGSGSVLLNASRVVITEDGTGPVDAPSNNWAKDNDGNGVIDTSNVTTKAIDNNGGTISYFSGSPANTPAVDQTGTSQNTDITKYIDTVPGAIAPSVTKTFTFQRLVN